MDTSGHPPTTSSSLLGWFSRHCPLPPSSLPAFLQPPTLPPPSSLDQGVGRNDGDGGEEANNGTELASEEEVTLGGDFKMIFNEVLKNIPAVGWFSIPSSSPPPSPQHPQAPTPSSMATLTPPPSPSLHISEVDLPHNRGHAVPAAVQDMEEVEEPAEPAVQDMEEIEEPAEPSVQDMEENEEPAEPAVQDIRSNSLEMEEPTAEAEEEQHQPPDFQMDAEPAAAANMGMMRKVKLPGRRRLCKLGNVSSVQDQLQEVGTSSWEMEEPPADCIDFVQEAVDHDRDAVAAAEEDQLPDFEMEVAVGSGKPPYKLQAGIFNKLYTHQREGLSWLWSLHCRGTGGILGDDMGLGKTMQVSAFLAGLFHSGLIRRVLIVTPPTIHTNWIEELSVVGLRDKIGNYYGPNKDDRNYELQHAFKEGGILLTTYNMVRLNYEQIRGDFYDDKKEGEMWNYVILDEAQSIKNSGAIKSQRLLEIPCVHRIAISGTPMQNTLKELWSIFSFCCPKVFSDKAECREMYERPIKEGIDKSACDEQKRIGSNVAKELRERIKPYFLHRKKTEVSLGTGLTDDKQLPKKNELIIWLKLTDRQRQLYKDFLNELVHLAASTGNLLPAITVLKQICNHPQIVPKRAAEHILEGMDGMLNNQEMEMAENNNQEMEMAEKMSMKLADLADDAVQIGPEVSCKLPFILALLRNLLEDGHHVLIFSQGCKMLDLIQEAILLEGYNFLRMDGNTKISERERIVKDFQEGLGAQIFLLTTKVGGLGLTLTKAARVIIVDPDWNPSTDNQCVDRVYRIGQTKEVIVYRLITSGTIEETIYKSQVLKCALFRAVTEKNEQRRYFDHSEIQDPFNLPEQGFDVSLTQKQLQEEHGHPLDMSESLRKDIEFLERQEIAGVSHHSLLFSKEAVLPRLSENDALGRDADPNPKDECAASRTNTSSENPEEINRLAETLASTTLESMPPECADQIVHDLDNEKLAVIPQSSSSEEVIC